MSHLVTNREARYTYDLASLELQVFPEHIARILCKFQF